MEDKPFKQITSFLDLGLSDEGNVFSQSLSVDSPSPSSSPEDPVVAPASTLPSGPSSDPTVDSARAEGEVSRLKMELEHVKVQYMAEKEELNVRLLAYDREVRAREQQLNAKIASLREELKRQASDKSDESLLVNQLRTQLRDLGPITRQQYLALCNTTPDRQSLANYAKMRAFETMQEVVKRSEDAERQHTHALHAATSEVAGLRMDLTAAEQSNQQLMKRTQSLLAENLRYREVYGDPVAPSDGAPTSGGGGVSRFDALKSEFSAVEMKRATAVKRAEAAEIECDSLRTRFATQETELQAARAELSRLRDRTRQLTDESALLREQASQAQASREQLLTRLLEERSQQRASVQEQVDTQLSSLQRASAQELATLRDRQQRVFEKELADLREAKDTLSRQLSGATARADKACREAEDARRQVLLVRSEADTQSAEHQGLMKLKSFECAQMATQLEAAQLQSNQLRTELERAQAKLQLLSGEAAQEVSARDAARGRLEQSLRAAQEKLSVYQQLELDLDRAIVDAGGLFSTVGERKTGGEGGAMVAGGVLATVSQLDAVLNTVGSDVPLANRRRVKQCILLARELHEVKTALQASRQNEALLNTALADAREREQDALRTAQAASQPGHGALVRIIAEKDERARELSRELESARSMHASLQQRCTEQASHVRQLAAQLQKLSDSTNDMELVKTVLVAQHRALSKPAADRPASGSKPSRRPRPRTTSHLQPQAAMPRWTGGYGWPASYHMPAVYAPGVYVPHGGCPVHGKTAHPHSNTPSTQSAGQAGPVVAGLSANAGAGDASSGSQNGGKPSGSSGPHGSSAVAGAGVGGGVSGAGGGAVDNTLRDKALLTETAQ